MDFYDYLLEYVCERGLPGLAPKLMKVRKNGIPINFIEADDAEITVGVSKSGGYPDLPPSIPYPIFDEFTEETSTYNFSTDTREAETNHYPASAMQLVAQINLEEANPFDKDNVLPKTGMLYFFWSGELPRQDFDVYKVIYYDGDLSVLKRTTTPLPYYTKYFEKPFTSYKLQFDRCRYEYDVEDLDEELEEIDNLYDEWRLEFGDYITKLLGYPVGVNITGCSANSGYTNLFQFGLGLHFRGCLHDIYWHIRNDDLAKRNFDNLYFDFDMD